MESSVNTGPAFWLIIAMGGAVLLGVALAYGLISTRRRRENPVAQRLTDAATRELYREEEGVRRHAAGEENSASITGARQGVTGHNVNLVLGASLMLAVFAGAGLFGYLWIARG